MRPDQSEGRIPREADAGNGAEVDGTGRDVVGGKGHGRQQRLLPGLVDPRVRRREEVPAADETSLHEDRVRQRVPAAVAREVRRGDEAHHNAPGARNPAQGRVGRELLLRISHREELRA